MKLHLLVIIMILKHKLLVLDLNLQGLILKKIINNLKIVKDFIMNNIIIYILVPLDELIKHALLALRETTQSSSEPLNFKNCSIGIVGINQPFIILEESKIQPYVIFIIIKIINYFF